MNWDLFYQLNKSLIDLNLIVGLIGLILIFPVTYVIQLSHYVNAYLQDIYSHNY